jgi:hypothetical protein
LNERVNSLEGCVKECDYDEVVIELVLFFAVEEKVIWDMVKDFEAAIAEAGRVDGKSFAGGGAMRILSTKHAENIAYV